VRCLVCLLIRRYYNIITDCTGILCWFPVPVSGWFRQGRSRPVMNALMDCGVACQHYCSLMVNDRTGLRFNDSPIDFSICLGYICGMSKVRTAMLSEAELGEREKLDKRFMAQAVTQAQKAMALDEVPIGCVIVYEGKVIGRGYNRRVTDHSTLAHAEITAIKKACRALGDWRLEDCTVYVTLEPCPMCAGAIVQARVPRVVIGCMNPKAGCAGSVVDLLHQEKLNHQCDVTIGILGEQCSGLLKRFFAKLREK